MQEELVNFTYFSLVEVMLKIQAITYLMEDLYLE